MGNLIGLDGAYSGWLPGPDLCECCWLLFVGGAGSGHEVAGYRILGAPGLALAHWWMESES